jgi:hypothetical protein
MKAIPCEKLTGNGRSRTTLSTTPFTEQLKEEWQAPVHN